MSATSSAAPAGARGGLVGGVAAAGGLGLGFAARRQLGGVAAAGGGLGLAGPDDRRGGMRVNSVGLDDFDVDQAGASDGGLELGAGEGACDAAGEGGHVGSGGVVHVGVGDDVRDGEAPAGAEHSGGLGDDLGLVGREVDDAVGDHHVDGG